MRTLWRTVASSVHVPFIDTLEETLHSFSASGRVLFVFFSGTLVFSTCALLLILNNSMQVVIPAHGGSLSEGIIGTPRFINPVLAVSDADHDLSQLVYSGLLKATPDGGYAPDLAESYTVSGDGKTYTFVLRKNATFQDGTPISADDVVFTIAKTQDPIIKSPERANWSGVNVQKIDDRTIQFTLGQAYAPFIENLTLGILPKRLWGNVSDSDFALSELNTDPVGSGPFRVSSISRTSSGVPSSYDLSAFSTYALGRPYLDTLSLHFYQNESDLVDGLKSGEIESASGISPAALPSVASDTIDRSTLDRVFAVFFNQNQSEVLRDAGVRDALNKSIDRNQLITQVLHGYGTAVTGPVPPGVLGSPSAATSAISAFATSTVATNTDLALAARNQLLASGWQIGQNGILQKTTGSGKSAKTVTLAFSLATGNVPELRDAAEYLRTTWEKVGAKVDVQVYDQGDLSQNVIRPRKYDALLFGEVIGREVDLFAFWDSSQRIDPGLNIALYANSTADKILEQLRGTADENQRTGLYQQFTGELAKDTPAVFLYAPDFVYIVPKDVHGLTLGLIETPSDRFLGAAQWYRETDHVWPIFAKK